jgi:hypothetical protein
MQRAARKVAEENSRLRSLLASRGVTGDEIDAYLRSFDASTAPTYTAHARPVQSRPATKPAYQSVARTKVPLPMPPAQQSPAPTSRQPLAPLTAQPPPQPPAHSSAESQCSGQPVPVALPASQASSCCRPADSDTHDSSAPAFPMLQDDAECPNTASCFCAPTPTLKETPLDTGLLISCETAATIIAEMRGDGDRSRIRASLGCVGDKECSVKNSRVLELMDER